MLPTIDFATIEDVIEYIDETIITNHNNEIVAVMHNNIENGLAKFIIEAPRNWDKASVISTAGNYVATEQECILIFKSTASGTISLVDNKWNEWTIVNRTNANKQLVGDIPTYRTIANTVKNYVTASSALCIVKGDDDSWYEVYSQNIAQFISSMRKYPQFVVGDVDSPLAIGGTTMTIVDDQIIDGFIVIERDGKLLPKGLPEVDSYESVYSTGQSVITYTNQAVEGMVFNIWYPVKIPLTYQLCDNCDNPVLSYFATLIDDETKTLYDTSGDIFFILSGYAYTIQIDFICNSQTDEVYSFTSLGSAKNVGGTVTYFEQSRVNLYEDIDITVQIVEDNILQGVKVVATGIAGKTITCQADFTFKKKSLSNA